MYIVVIDIAASGLSCEPPYLWLTVDSDDNWSHDGNAQSGKMLTGFNDSLGFVL